MPTTAAATALESSSGLGPWYVWTAALVIAAALSAGFAALGRRGAFVRSVLGTLALFGLAVALNAGTAPTVWACLYGVWAALLAFALIRTLLPPRALPHHPLRTPPARRRSLIAAGLGLVLALGGVAGLRATAAGTLDKADAAQLAGDCAAALPYYTRIEGELNEFTLSPAPSAARTGRFACEQTLAAERAVKSGDPEAAENAYWYAVVNFEDRFGTKEPRLAELRLAHGDAKAAVERARAAEYTGVSAVWNSSGNDEIIRIYQAIVTDTPDSPQAELVPARIDALHTDALATAAKHPCAGMGQLADLVRLGEEQLPGATAVAAKARDDLPRVRYTCGRAQYEDKKYQDARETLNEVTTGPYAKKAADLLIAVDVADAAKGSAGALPPPAAEGTAPAGTTELVITNDSHEQLEVLYVGPENGTDRIDACPTCTTRSLPTLTGRDLFDTCSSSAKEVTIRLKPGTYDVVVRGAGGSDVRPYTGKWRLKSGTSYASCFYISRSLF
ncbi:hypothetical protein [Streptomyces sp. NPDC056144]|uniref:hypothetical protein n=1 Tax=unclassified Streptomyces TaxID=2593676 RepID=UPI0035DA0D86